MQYVVHWPLFKNLNACYGTPIDFDAWSEVISGREGFRMDSWQGRDPATGLPIENPPSAMRAFHIVDGNDAGMFAYDESHLRVLLFATDDRAASMHELAQILAKELSCDYSPA